MARQNITLRFIAKRPALVDSSILWTQQRQQRHTQKNMCSHLVCSIDVSTHAMYEPNRFPDAVRVVAACQHSLAC